MGPAGAGDPLLSCSILTRAASPALATVRDRMPVVLPEAVHETWLDPSLSNAAKIMTMIRECAINEFSHHAVSTRVNSPKNVDAEIIAPVTSYCRYPYGRVTSVRDGPRSTLYREHSILNGLGA